jgi:hypothetical protein
VLKQNPFDGLSAAAMLGGCGIVDEALKLEPGHLANLLTLVALLQLDEALLLSLGVFLVVTRRARRDGVMVLMLETLFLLDATFLATECGTADARVGALVCGVLMTLAAAKLALVRRLLPDALAEAAILLGGQTALVLGVPLAASGLARAGLLAPASLYGLWWIALALPLARDGLLEATRDTDGSAPSRAHSRWTWWPAGSVLLHLWVVGWIHGVSFHPAFGAPLLLGPALSAERGQVARPIVLPSLAVLVPWGQAETLAVVLPTPPRPRLPHSGWLCWARARRTRSSPGATGTGGSRPSPSASG